MKAKELMIGDWVLDKAASDKPVQIKQINEQNVHYKRGNGYMSAGVELLEPIPLTSDLLEEKGFERVPQPGCANPYHWMLEKYEEESEGLLYRIKAYKTPFRGMYVSIDNYADCETINFGKQIEHVHELQHVFRLCDIGIDL